MSIRSAIPADSTPQNVARIEAGREIFLTTCAACHGEDAKGNTDVGAPNLTDRYLDLRRRSPDHHHLHPWRTTRTHADLGRASDALRKSRSLRSMSIPWASRIHDGNEHDGTVRTKRLRFRWWYGFWFPPPCCSSQGANAHLIYVAFSSQPECVDHLKKPEHRNGPVQGGEVRLLKNRRAVARKTDERC